MIQAITHFVQDVTPARNLTIQLSDAAMSTIGLLLARGEPLLMFFDKLLASRCDRSIDPVDDAVETLYQRVLVRELRGQRLTPPLKLCTATPAIHSKCVELVPLFVTAPTQRFPGTVHNHRAIELVTMLGDLFGELLDTFDVSLLVIELEVMSPCDTQ